METIYELPMFALGALELLLAILLLLPNFVALPAARAFHGLTKHTATNTVMITLAFATSMLLLSAVVELVRGIRHSNARSTEGQGRDTVDTIDYLRAKVSTALCAMNLVVLLLCRALSQSLVMVHHSEKNLDAFKRQVKGLQTEYDRVTDGSKDGKAGAAGDDATSALRAQVDKLIKEKQELQAAEEEARKAKAAAEANVNAMKSQLKGFDAEYDRVTQENGVLKRKLAIAGDTTYVAEIKEAAGHVSGKKEL